MPYPHTYIKLTPKERQDIGFLLKQVTVKQDWRARKRLRAICLSDEGRTINHIARQVNAGERSVRRWFARYQNKGLKGLIRISLTTDRNTPLT